MKVAIVGRPNVGKSSLFNVLTKSRDALVHDRPGVTRDVIAGQRDGITILDTAGLENRKTKIENRESNIGIEATEKSLAAAKEADVVLFIVDARAGLHPMDIEWARMIQRSAGRQGQKIILLANKCESRKGLDNLHEFYQLGFGAPIPISAEHNLGIGELLSELRQESKAENNNDVRDPDAVIRVAIMGVPNVGKSTLINRILGTKRVLVADMPGVTRDVVKLPTHYLGRDIQLVDTAGLRKKAKVTDDVETLAALKSLAVLEESDVVILVIDATGTVDAQAVKIAERVYDAGKILIVALNKWDKVPAVMRDDKQLELKKSFGHAFSQIIKPIVLPISAETGQGVANMMKRAFEQFDISESRAPTSLVNRTIEKLVAEKSPPMSRLKRPMKIKFARQVGIHPSRILINVGGASDIPPAYTRYLRRGISTKFGWESIPVVVEYETAENPYDS